MVPPPDPPPAADEPLSPVEARVLGSLIEKELATPEYYPLSLNALVNACNQKSNRHPVLALGAHEVELALDALRRRRLAGLFAGADARVPKFKHTIDLVHPMETAERVVLCELLLRGPQTPGELRNRCERLHPIADPSEAEAILQRLAERPAGPLVTRLERQPGQKEARFAHLLSGPPAPGAPAHDHADASEPPTGAEARLAALEREIAELRARLDDLRRRLGAD